MRAMVAQVTCDQRRAATAGWPGSPLGRYALIAVERFDKTIEQVSHAFDIRLCQRAIDGRIHRAEAVSRARERVSSSRRNRKLARPAISRIDGSLDTLGGQKPSDHGGDRRFVQAEPRGYDALADRPFAFHDCQNRSLRGRDRRLVFKEAIGRFFQPVRRKLDPVKQSMHLCSGYT